MQRQTLMYILWACLAGNASFLGAADKVPAFTDPEKAGPDFHVQGEYVGLVGKEHKIAAQVIAMGNGQFEGVLYGGGLPGAGWDGHTRFALKGETKGDVTQFTGIVGERLRFHDPNFQGVITGGFFRGQAEMFRNVIQNTAFSMKKIHRRSPTMGAKPPPGAIVLFDGSGADQWAGGRLVEGNLLDVGTYSKRQFNSLKFHLEFRTPFMPTGRGMGRGNSGVYVKKEWEIQIVDSFGWNSDNRKYERLANFARCGGIHEMVKPRVNMCYPPLSWQTYDVEFLAARFDPSGHRTVPAMISVRHNGVVIHDKYVLPPTSPGRSGPSKEHLPGPLSLQDHGNPVRFRNIWVIEE